MSNYYLRLPQNSYPKSCKNCWIPCGFAELGCVHKCPFIITEDTIKKKLLYELMTPTIAEILIKNLERYNDEQE